MKGIRAAFEKKGINFKARESKQRYNWRKRVVNNDDLPRHFLGFEIDGFTDICQSNEFTRNDSFAIEPLPSNFPTLLSQKYNLPNLAKRIYLQYTEFIYEVDEAATTFQRPAS